MEKNPVGADPNGNWLDTLGKFVGAGTGIISAFKQPSEKRVLAPNEKPPMDNSKLLIFGGIGAVVLIVVALIFTRK